MQSVHEHPQVIHDYTARKCTEGSKSRHQECLPNIGGTPRGPPTAGYAMDGGLFVDSALPFGLQSALKIFTALADALEWIVWQAGVEMVFHYLVDFLFVGNPSSEQSKVDLQRLLEVFDRLHIPVAIEILEGPVMVIIFLGIEVDTAHYSTPSPGEALDTADPMADKEILPQEGPPIIGRNHCSGG